MEAKQSEADRRRVEVLREGYELEAALQAGIERLCAESFRRGEAVMVEIDGKVLLEGPEGRCRLLPEGRRLTWEDLKFDDSPAV